MPPHHAMRPVAEMRGERCAGIHGGGNLPSRGASMSDRCGDTGIRDRADVAGRFRPVRRKRDEPDVAVRRVLPAMEFGNIRRTHPAPRMRSARAIFGFDVRAFHVKPGDGTPPRQFPLCLPQVSQALQHVVGTAGNHGGQAARDAGSENGVERERDLSDRRAGVVEVQTRETVHLDVDEAGRKPHLIFGRRDRADLADQMVEFDFNGIAGRDIHTGTLHANLVLYTPRPQRFNTRISVTPTFRTKSNLLKCATGTRFFTIQQGNG
jgi:hypothetical protein